MHVIVGEEVSTKEGHVIGLFLEEWIPPGMDAAHTVEEIHRQGGIAIAAHPYTNLMKWNNLVGVGDLILSLPFDAVEIRNSNFTEFRANRKAARNLGMKAQVGSSDGHFLESVGRCFTVFPGGTADDLRSAILGRTTLAQGSCYGLRTLARFVARRLRAGQRVLPDRRHFWRESADHALAIEVQKSRHLDTAVVTPVGRLDDHALHELKSTLTRLADSGVSLVVDLARVNAMTAHGVTALVAGFRAGRAPRRRLLHRLSLPGEPPRAGRLAPARPPAVDERPPRGAAAGELAGSGSGARARLIAAGESGRAARSAGSQKSSSISQRASSSSSAATRRCSTKGAAQNVQYTRSPFFSSPARMRSASQTGHGISGAPMANPSEGGEGPLSCCSEALTSPDPRVKLVGPVLETLSRSDHVVHSIREGILRGTWKAGERLPGERDMANRLGVNRSSVREALKKLELLRLVAIRPGGRATVSPVEGASVEILRHLLFAGGTLDRVVAEQLLDFREMLTVGAARLALERASEEDLVEARTLLSKLCAPGVTLGEHLGATEQLFALMVRASGNLVLALVRNALLAADDPALRATRQRLRHAIAVDVIAPIARELDAAIAVRDPDALEKSVRRLLRESRAHVLSALESFSPPPTASSAALR